MIRTWELGHTTSRSQVYHSHRTVLREAPQQSTSSALRSSNPEGMLFLSQDEMGILRDCSLAEPSLLPVYTKGQFRTVTQSPKSPSGVS